MMIDMNINIQEAQQTPSKMNTETKTETHYSQIFKRQRQRVNLEGGEKGVNHHI